METRAAIDAFNAQSVAQSWEQLCDPALAFAHRDYGAVIALTAQAAGRAMPARADMTARVLKTYLPNIAIKERVARDPSRYRWRLIGTRVAQVIGERTGTLAEENASPRLAARANANCDLTLLARMPLRFVGRVLTQDKDYLASEALYLPLADDTGEARFVLGFGYFRASQDWREALTPACRSRRRLKQTALPSRDQTRLSSPAERCLHREGKGTQVERRTPVSFVPPGSPSLALRARRG